MSRLYVGGTGLLERKNPACPSVLCFITRETSSTHSEAAKEIEGIYVVATRTKCGLMKLEVGDLLRRSTAFV